MRDNGCTSPKREVRAKCGMNDSRADKHKYIVPLTTQEGNTYPTVDEVSVLLPEWHEHGVLFGKLPLIGNLVTADLYWDNYQHPPTVVNMSVCAWCYARLWMEAWALNKEEDRTNSYYVHDQKVPRQCLKH